MHDPIAAALLAVFVIHLGAFVALGIRRRQLYYLALVLTFSLLSTSYAVRLFWPEATLGGDSTLLHAAIRQSALLAAGISIAWTAYRLKQRLVARHDTPTA